MAIFRCEMRSAVLNQTTRFNFILPDKCAEDVPVVWLHQLRELNPQKLEHRRRLINSFVNAIYLYDDYLVFVGNYKDSTKTITFAELEEIGLGSDTFVSGVSNKREDTHPVSSLLFRPPGGKGLEQ